jgi:hypothetical protein
VYVQAQLERLRREEEAAQRAANELVERWKRAKAEADEAAVSHMYEQSWCWRECWHERSI